MGNVSSPLLPASQRLLEDLGQRLKLARLRRGLQAKQVAERAGMAPLTLRSIERGSATVTMGAYLSVMQVLGLENDINQIAGSDEVGRHLQDARLVPASRSRTSAPLGAGESGSNRQRGGVAKPVAHTAAAPKSASQHKSRLTAAARLARKTLTSGKNES